MEKIIYRILGLLTLLMGFNVESILAEDRFGMESIVVKPGETATLSISLKNETPFYGFQADVILPTGLKFKLSDGEPDVSLSNRFDDSYQIISNVLEDNHMRLGAFSASHNPISGNDGSICNIDVIATDSFEGGEIKITKISCITVADKDIILPDISSFIDCIIPPKEVKISQSSAELHVGETLQLIAYVFPENTSDKTIIWSSADEGISTVDASGNVTAIALGETVIIAQCGKVSAECKVKVIATPVESVTLNVSSAELKIGETLTLSATVLPEDATDKSVEWMSDDASIVTVDATGKVTAKALGQTVITATSGNVSAECKVSVIATPVESISLNVSSAELKAGETLTLSATVLPEDATDKSVEWSSADESIATVDATGKVTAKALGQTVITATSGNVSAECKVSVIATPVESIILNVESAQLKVGESLSLAATVLPEDATDKSVEWSSADEGIATVDASGNVTAVALGETVITARSGNVSAECKVSVIATPVESISLNVSSAELKVGETLTLSASVFPEDATDKSVEWSSADEGIAIVDASGNVTAISLGETHITARSGNVSADCKVSVVATPVESIILNVESAQLKVGETLTLSATVLPEDATDKSVEWSSADEGIAFVDALGNITAISLGETVITAHSGNVSADCKVSVVATPVESISLNVSSAELKVGENLTLSATVLPEDATDKSVEWSSADEGIATVDAYGNLTAISLGETLITARSGNVSAECKVSVVATPVESISLNVSSAELKVGETLTLSATVLPEDATDKSVEWSSADEGIATVDASGNVTAVELGEAVITARSGNVSAECKVSVVATPVESISLNVSSAELKVGETLTLSASVFPEDATDKSVKWSSADESIAIVDAYGMVTAKALGQTVITATAGNVSAECKVSVIATPVESIILNVESAQLKVGERITLQVSVYPEDSTDQTIRWVSADSSIASVDEFGNVTANSIGETVITASCGNISKDCQISVIETIAEGIYLNVSYAELKIGETFGLQAYILPEDVTDHTIVWSSADQSIASVDQNGRVTAKKSGETVIAARCGNVCAECQISVISETMVEGINLNINYAEMKVGEIIRIEASVFPEDATDKSIVWSSEDIGIASVDEYGNVTANALGETIITARCGDVTAECHISVIETIAQGISLNIIYAELKVGDTICLEASVYPEDASYKSVEWTSSDSGIATVDEYGYVTAISLGQTAITARCGNITVDCLIKVIQTLADAINLNITYAEIKVGESISLEAYIYPENTTDKTIEWSSADSTIASIDSRGTVTANAVGETVITARCGDVSVDCTIVVNSVLAEVLEIDPTEWSGEIGSKLQISVNVWPEDTTDKTVQFESSNDDIATVDSEGIVEIVADGTCIISVTTLDGSGLIAECQITGMADISEIVEESANIEVFNTNGILIKHCSSAKDLEYLTPGIYIIRIGNTHKTIYFTK